MAGSVAAAGLSMADMEKRLQLEQWKSQMLRNLNMFVSQFRLVIHNLPPSWNDSKLRHLFLQHAGPKAVIKVSIYHFSNRTLCLSVSYLWKHTVVVQMKVIF